MVRLVRDLGNPRVPPFERWEFFKDNIKMSAIERSSEIVFQARLEEKELIENLNSLCILECVTPGVHAHDISLIKSKLNVITEARYRGAIVRARAEKFLFGELPTKRALASEKKYALSKEINIIQNGPVPTSDKAIIIQTFVKHYSTLFSTIGTESNLDKLRSLLDNMPVLSGVETSSLETPIELEETLDAIDTSSPCKSPGPDGITAGFYKTFKNSISPFLLILFRYAYKANVLPPTFTRTHTVLIPKTDDPDKLHTVCGYRPITLCNVDYKIFAKILTAEFNMSYAISQVNTKHVGSEVEQYKQILM